MKFGAFCAFFLKEKVNQFVIPQKVKVEEMNHVIGGNNGSRRFVMR